MNIFKKCLLNERCFNESIESKRVRIGGQIKIIIEKKKILKADILPILKEINPSIEEIEAVTGITSEVQSVDEFADIICDVSHITI